MVDVGPAAAAARLGVVPEAVVDAVSVVGRLHKVVRRRRVAAVADLVVLQRGVLERGVGGHAGGGAEVRGHGAVGDGVVRRRSDSAARLDVATLVGDCGKEGGISLLGGLLPQPLLAMNGCTNL